ncbi:MAG TPA: recombination-associated protein RdgC [Anaeromyxobacteraceae bacterium]|nr:recombination-associated protein RdgC [Anaeromyxobacteraceae bacterium]
MVRAPMPIQSGTVSFARFRSEPAGARPDAKRWLLRGLRKKAFEPLEARKPDDDRAAGFVELEDHDATGFEAGLFQGEHALFAWRIDQLKVPAKALKAEVDRWAAAFAAGQGRPPTRREKAARKEEVRQLLRQKAEPSSKVLDVSWNLDTGEVAIWATSRKVVDEIAATMEEVFTVSLHPVSVGATAARSKLAEAALGPTPALVGLGQEVSHDAA